MKKSIMNSIYTEMRSRIISGVYPPEMVISEPQVAQEFGSSKTPAREAMALLTQEGFLIRFPGCGYVVRRVDANELKEICVFRRTIEHGIFESILEFSPDSELRTLRASLEQLLIDSSQIDERFNIDFHLTLAELSHNRFYVSALEQALSSAARGFQRLQEKAYYQSKLSEPERIENLIRNHIAIVDALLAHDLEQAFQALDHDYAEQI